MFGNVYRRIAALPLVLKVLLAVATLIVLGLSVLLSPLVAFVALLVLIFAVAALIFRALRRRPLRNWGLIALTSLLFLVVFGGITNALYGGGTPQQASSPPEEPKEEAAPAPPETTTEPTTQATTPSKTTAETPTGKAAPVPSKPSEEDAREEDEGDRGGYDATATVTRVIDGDTLEISPAVYGRDRVRLIGVDTPETRDPGCVEPYGAQAKTFVDSELQGEEVDLEFDEDRTDRYDRLLAYIHEGGEVFNETLLGEGYAQVYIVEPNDRYEDRFREAQEEARVAGRGLWALPASELEALADRGNGIGGGGGCAPEVTTAAPKAPPPPEPIPDPVAEPDPMPDLDAPDTPGTGGGSYPPISRDSCPSNAPVKGNQSGIYHVPGGQFYDRTNPEECFASEADAAAAGYRRSQR